MHTPPSSDRRALIATGWLTGGYFLIELAVGLWTGSVAVTSDAFHTFSAVGGVLIALVAAAFSRRPASGVETFGLIRAEILGAFLNGLFLVGMAGVVFWMGVMRLLHPIHLHTGPMLAVAAGGVVTEVIALRLLHRGQRGNLNVRGAYWHILQTFVGSLIIVVSALVIRFTGFLAIDPLLGMAFGLVLVYASWGILRDSMSILLERTPKRLDLPSLVQHVSAVPGVRDVHHLHAWSLTSGKDLLSAHLCIEQGADPEETRRRVEDLLRHRFGIYFSTLQTEHTCRAEEEPAPEIDVARAERPRHRRSAT